MQRLTEDTNAAFYTVGCANPLECLSKSFVYSSLNPLSGRSLCVLFGSTCAAIWLTSGLGSGTTPYTLLTADPSALLRGLVSSTHLYTSDAQAFALT